MYCTRVRVQLYTNVKRVEESASTFLRALCCLQYVYTYMYCTLRKTPRARAARVAAAAAHERGRVFAAPTLRLIESPRSRATEQAARARGRMIDSFRQRGSVSQPTRRRARAIPFFQPTAAFRHRERANFDRNPCGAVASSHASQCFPQVISLWRRCSRSRGDVSGG